MAGRVRTNIGRWPYLTLALLGFLVVIGIWSLLTYTAFIKPFFLPTPTAVLSALGELLLEKGLLIDIWASFYRVIIGFLLAAIVSIPLGLFIGTFTKFEAFAGPLVGFVRYLPYSAFVPLFILWFGIGDIQKFAVIFISVSPFLTIFVADAVANVKKELLESAYTLGATTKDIIWRVMLPTAMPSIWNAMQLLMGAAWAAVVIAEIVASKNGLGHLIIQSQRFLQTDQVITGILVIGLVGIIMDLFFRITYRLLFPWSEQIKNVAR